MAARDEARELTILLQRRLFANRPAIISDAYQEAVASLTSALEELERRINEELQGTLTVSLDGDKIAVNYHGEEHPIAQAHLNKMNPPGLVVQYFTVEGEGELESEYFLLVPNPDGGFGWMCKGYIDVGATGGQAADAILEQTLAAAKARLTLGDGLKIGTN